MIKINIIRWIIKPHPNTWWNWQQVILLDDGCIQKISTAQNLCAYGSPLFLTDAIWALEYTEYNINVLKQDVMKMLYLFNIQYNIIITDCTKGWHWKLSPLENHSYPQVQALFIYHNTFINRLLVRHQVMQSNKDVKILVLRVQ